MDPKHEKAIVKKERGCIVNLPTTLSSEDLICIKRYAVVHFTDATLDKYTLTFTIDKPKALSSFRSMLSRAFKKHLGIDVCNCSFDMFHVDGEAPAKPKIVEIFIDLSELGSKCDLS